MENRKEQLLQGRNQLLEAIAQLTFNEFEAKKGLVKLQSRKEAAVEDLVQLTQELNELLAKEKEAEQDGEK